MDEQKIRRIVQDELKRGADGSRFGIKSTNYHTHDGVNSLNINEDNLTLGTKYLTQLTSIEPETFSLLGLKSVGKVTFLGFAANNAANLSSTATKKASVQGEVIFGNCFQPVGSGSQISADAATQAPFLQGSSYFYVDTSSLVNTRTGSAASLAQVSDESGSTVAQLELVRATQDTLTFTTTFATGWQLTGIIIIE